MAQTEKQTGILLLQNDVGPPPRLELPVPRPPPPPALPNPLDYAHLLPNMPPGRLCAWVAPPTRKLGPPIIIIADPRHRCELEARGQLGKLDLNGQAVFLTVNLQSGFGEQICGSALAFFAEPGRDLTLEYYNALDDVLRGPLMGYYEDGAPPREDDWHQLAAQLDLEVEQQRQYKAEQEADPLLSLPRCESCGAAHPPKQCSRCKAARYCSVDCQRNHYGQHKFVCRSLAAAHGHAVA